MTVNAARYQPLFPSEQLLRGFDGQPPFLGCGLSTDIICTAWATLGESQIRPNGRPFDTADFTNQLKVGWRAFERVHDANGMPDRDDVPRIHRAMFPGLPLPQPLETNDFDQVVELLRTGEWVLSFAGRLADVGLPLAKYTRADHQFPLADLKAGKATVQDPMHPPALKWAGHGVPLAQVEKAGRDLPDRTRVLAWKYPVGGWTHEAMAVEALRDRLREAREDVAGLTDRVKAKNLTIADLQRQLSDAGGTDCSNPIAAALETERIAIRDSVDARRSL